MRSRIVPPFTISGSCVKSPRSCGANTAMGTTPLQTIRNAIRRECRDSR